MESPMPKTLESSNNPEENADHDPECDSGPNGEYVVGCLR